MILFFVGIAMIAPVVYIFSDVLDFASYAIAIWFRWNGVVFFVLACWLLWRSHRDLGENWTFTLKTNKKHQLVTTGVYRYLRHPMYAAHFSWAIAQLIMIPNWIAGPSFLVFALVLYCYRVGSEEEMMMDTFGDAYREYRSVTGRIFPRIFNFFSD
jgi:protein-S-isoprenylcysteine O-methyltransferase Ste14